MKKLSMEEYIKRANMTHLVRELVDNGVDPYVAIEYVYDGLTLSHEEFDNKYTIR